MLCVFPIFVKAFLSFFLDLRWNKNERHLSESNINLDVIQLDRRTEEWSDLKQQENKHDSIEIIAYAKRFNQVCKTKSIRGGKLTSETVKWFCKWKLLPPTWLWLRFNWKMIHFKKLIVDIFTYLKVLRQQTDLSCAKFLRWVGCHKFNMLYDREKLTE